MALRVITNIDDMFAGALSKDIIANAQEMNFSGKEKKPILKFSEDNNTYKKIFKRLMRKGNRTNPIIYFYTLIDIIVNIWHFILTNIQLLWYNYFAAISVIYIQFIGFYRQQKAKLEETGMHKLD